jgi:ABC-2 type transport system ATP-binding protein
VSDAGRTQSTSASNASHTGSPSNEAVLGDPAQTNMISATNVVKKWGSNTVLHDATFTVTQGVTGLLGANGAGKTTFFGMVLGFHTGDSGTLRVLGLDPFKHGAEVRGRIGYSPEHDALPVDMKAHDFVRHVAELHGIPTREAIARASDALFEVGLGEERFRPVGTMSTGQKQRVKLAQAIVHDPALVLLDEPTNGLDPVQRDHMLSLIKRCGDSLGLTIVVSTHLLEEVERTCDRVVILANGRASVQSVVADLHEDGADIEVELANVSGSPQWMANVVSTLRRAGLDATDTSLSALRVVYETPETFDQLRDALVLSEAPVRVIRRTQRRLADVFLEASDVPDEKLVGSA